METSAFREVDDVPERALQVIWQQQRLKAGLRLGDGRRIEVLHPGFWNHEAGPDFKRAVVRIDREGVVHGDVEIDVEIGGWRAHGHHTDPNFRNVVMRVVWKLPKTSRESILPLQPNLDSPWGKLREWALNEPAGDLPARLQGRCCSPLQGMVGAERLELLEQAARVRLRLKSDQVLARAKQVGWEQSLMEGLFAGLGYKRNAWPMRAVAAAMNRINLGESEGVESKMSMALMLGIAGLMPEDWSQADRRRSQYLKDLWSLWWRMREAVRHEMLPRQIWSFAGVRPANRPERRLALANQWLAAGDVMPRLEHWCEGDLEGPSARARLLGILAQRSASFWDDRCTFVANPMPTKAPLIGAARLTDLVVNTVLPWLHARAGAGRNRSLAGRLQGAYLVWPKGEDNSVLRLARQRLLGTTSARVLKTAGQQQGLLQIVRDFCSRSDALCADCPFPDYVRHLMGDE